MRCYAHNALPGQCTTPIRCWIARRCSAAGWTLITVAQWITRSTQAED